MTIDRFDAQLIELLTAEPRIGVFEVSRRLGVARGTVQARLDKLQRTGVIADFAPTIEPGALGYPVMAFITAEIAQGHRNTTVVEHLRSVPEVLEAHSITGQGDLMVRVAAQSNRDLQRVMDELLSDPNIVRTSTAIVLETQVVQRTLPLVKAAARRDDTAPHRT